MPLLDAAGSEGTDAPAQIVSEGLKLNVGVVLLFTVTVKLVAAAH